MAERRNMPRDRQRDQIAWPWQWFEDAIFDVKYALRGLWRNPEFAVTAVLTVALASGVNTAMFTVLYGTLLAPLGYLQPERLVEVSMMQRTGGKLISGTSVPNLNDWKAQARCFESLGAHRPQFFVNLTGYGHAEEVQAWRVSAELLETLGVRPLLGDWFGRDHNTSAGPRSALLSYGLWRDRFHESRDVLGKALLVDGEPFTIAGVMPGSFEFPPLVGSSKPAIWLSLNVSPDAMAQRGRHSLIVVGRLKSGVSIKSAQAEMETIANRLATEHRSENGEWPDAAVSPLSAPHYVRRFRSVLWLISAAAALVFIVGCANVASLQLARAATRDNEFAVRSALGVSKSRLIRQVLTESCVITGVGCAMGVLLAYWSVPILKAMLEGRPRADEISIRPAVLAFSMGLLLLAGLLSGMIPALRAGAFMAGKGQPRRTAAPHKWLRTLIVAAEIAFTLLLLCSAVTQIGSLWRVTHVDLGFDPDHVLSFRLNLPESRYRSAVQVEAFREGLLRHLRRLPGVEFAGTNSAPPMGVVAQATDFDADSLNGRVGNASFSNVSVDYLRAMGIPLLRGRNFAAVDRAGSTPVVIVSRSVTTKYFPSVEPLGQQIRLHRFKDAPPFTIVGVSADVVNDPLAGRTESTIYALSSQLPESEQKAQTARLMTVVLRTMGDPYGAADGVRQSLSELDRDQPIADIAALRDSVEKRLSARVYPASLIALFAGLALTLALVGVFGLVSYSVSRRYSEIGIRMVLGARPLAIVSLVMRDLLVSAAIGLLAGTFAAFGASRFVASLVADTNPATPLAVAACAFVLMSAVVAAGLYGARAAKRMDPLTAIRHE